MVFGMEAASYFAALGEMAEAMFCFMLMLDVI